MNSENKDSFQHGSAEKSNVDSTEQKAEVTNTSADLPAMSREEALRLLGLSSDAKMEVIDQRFYQLTKRFRIEKDQESLSKITAAYEIASGRAEQKAAEIEAHQSAKKIFGKTKLQWSTYFYYSWWKYVIAAVLVVLVAYMATQMINGNNFDIRIVSVGHFKQESQYLTDFAVEELQFQNPYVVSSDIEFADPTAKGTGGMNEALAAFSYLAATPDVILLDEPTAPYFIEYLSNLDGYYEALRLALPADVFDSIEPLRYSFKDSYTLRGLNFDDYEYEPGDEEQHIYGLIFKDPKMYQALGFLTRWQTGDKLVVIGLSVTSENSTSAESFIAEIIKNQKVIIDRYEKANGEITVYTGVPAESTMSTDETTLADAA